MFISAYLLGGEKSMEEIESCWNVLNVCVRSFGKNESVVVLGYLNNYVGNELLEEIVGQYGVLGRTKSGRKITEDVCRAGFSGWKRFVQEKDVHNFMWVRIVEGIVSDRSLIEYVLLPIRMSGKLLDVKMCREGE